MFCLSYIPYISYHFHSDLLLLLLFLSCFLLLSSWFRSSFSPFASASCILIHNTEGQWRMKRFLNSCRFSRRDHLNDFDYSEQLSLVSLLILILVHSFVHVCRWICYKCLWFLFSFSFALFFSFSFAFHLIFSFFIRSVWLNFDYF